MTECGCQFCLVEQRRFTGVCGCAHTKVVREGVTIAEVPRFLTLGWVWLLFVSYPSTSTLVKSIQLH